MSPHWEVYGDWGDRTVLDEFRARVLARLVLLPRDDPQFRRNRERIVRDAERELISLEWDLGRPDEEYRRGARHRWVDDRFINRELSWLAFNERVLQLASEPGIPLLERAKFCAITTTNLDEFFQVRVAALKDQVAAGIEEPTADGRTATQQLAAITELAGELVAHQEHIFLDELVPALHG